MWMTRKEAKEKVKKTHGFRFYRIHMFCPIVRDFDIFEGFENGTRYNWKYHNYYLFGFRVAQIRIPVE